MSRNQQVVLGVTAGADMAAHVVWSDDNGNPIPCDLPARAEVRNNDSLLVAFDDGSDAATAANISCSPSAGTIQLTAPRAVTTTWAPGVYVIDVFATVTGAADPFAAGQYRPAFSGQFIVRKAVTQGAP